MSDRHAGVVGQGIDTFRDDDFVWTPLESGAAPFAAALRSLADATVPDHADSALAPKATDRA
jgi:hypothetical protein